MPRQSLVPPPDSYGRPILGAEETPGPHPVVVLGDAFRRSRFATDPAVVGRSVALNGKPSTVAGVGPSRSRWTRSPPATRWPYAATGACC